MADQFPASSGDGVTTIGSWSKWALLLAPALCIAVGAMGARTAHAAPSLREAMEKAVRTLLADLFADRGQGRVVSIQGRRHVILHFSGGAPPTDTEYLLVRSRDTTAGGSPETVGAIRVAEVQGDLARAVVLWRTGDVRQSDEAIRPSRITMILLPTEAEDVPALLSLKRHLDRWLELELLTDRRLRVIRADQPKEEQWRIKRLREERAYGLVIAARLARETDGVEVTLRVRSIFTGRTLARSRGVWITGRGLSGQPQSVTAPRPPPSSGRPRE